MMQKNPINLLFEMVFSGNTTCLTFYCEMEKGLGKSGRQIGYQQTAYSWTEVDHILYF